MSKTLNDLFSNGIVFSSESNTNIREKKNIISINATPDSLGKYLSHKKHIDDYKLHIFMSDTEMTVEELIKFSDLIQSLSFIKRIIIHIPKYLDKPLYVWIKNLLIKQDNVKIISHTKLGPLFYMKTEESDDHKLFTMLSIVYIQKLNKWQIHLDDIDTRHIPKKQRDLIFK